jgi:hypothetical protein
MWPQGGEITSNLRVDCASLPLQSRIAAIAGERDCRARDDR